jgi:hypothetical protein
MGVSFKCFLSATDMFAIVKSFFICNVRQSQESPGSWWIRGLSLAAPNQFSDFVKFICFFSLPFPFMCLVSHQVPFLVGRHDCWCHRSGFTIAQRSVPNLPLFHSRVLKRVSLFRENSWSINVCPWLVAGSKLKAYARRKREAKPSKRKKRRAHWAILADAIRRI